MPMTYPFYNHTIVQYPFIHLFVIPLTHPLSPTHFGRICIESWLLWWQYRDCLCLRELRWWYCTRIRLSLHIILGKGIITRPPKIFLFDAHFLHPIVLPILNTYCDLTLSHFLWQEYNFNNKDTYLL